MHRVSFKFKVGIHDLLYKKCGRRLLPHFFRCDQADNGKPCIETLIIESYVYVYTD
jgi:hypothetical protein